MASRYAGHSLGAHLACSSNSPSYRYEAGLGRGIPSVWPLLLANPLTTPAFVGPTRSPCAARCRCLPPWVVWEFSRCGGFCALVSLLGFPQPSWFEIGIVWVIPIAAGFAAGADPHRITG